MVFCVQDSSCWSIVSRSSCHAHHSAEPYSKLYEKHADGSDFLSEEEFLAKREEQLDIIRQGTEAIEDEKEKSHVF